MMRHRIGNRRFIPLLSLMLLTVALPATAQERQQARLERHVYTLASDSLQGRAAGSADGAKARDYIVREWKAMGLQPLWGDSYEMPFRVYNQEGYCNLLAIIEGNDEQLKDEYVVIGGHYDHLGVRNGEVYNGADDNASGTACVTEVARQLLRRRGELKRSVIVCAFDAEEMGLLGSKALADHLEKLGMIGQVKLMMSVDMVGWMKATGELKLEGTGTLEGWQRLTAADGQDIKIVTKRFETSLMGATDTEPFAKKGVPTLYVSTGLKSPYHKPEDDADLIDYEGLDRVTDYMTGLTLRASQTAGNLSSGKVSPKHDTRKRTLEVGLAGGFNTSCVSLPDASFVTKRLMGGQGGLVLQWNWNKTFSLHAEVLYTYIRSRFPDATIPFEEGFRQQQHALTVPLTLRMGPNIEGVILYIELGGYYCRQFGGEFYLPKGKSLPETAQEYNIPTVNQWGIVWGIGIRLGRNWGLDFKSYYQLNKLWVTSGGLPEAYNRYSTFALNYYF